MANEEHVALLMQGDVDVWNAWRLQNPQICPDLSGAFLVRPAATEAKGVEVGQFIYRARQGGTRNGSRRLK